MINELYAKLRSLNISVREVDGRLDIQAARGTLTKELLDEIKSQKDGLITLVRSYRSRKNMHYSIPSAQAAPDYVLSSSQRRLWMLSQLEEGNIAYNIPSAYVFEGALNIGALEYAFKKIIDRHEILRTVFREDGQGQIRQVVLAPGGIPFSIWTQDLPADNDQVARQLVAAEFIRPFDLANGPLLRVALYRITPDKWVFAYVTHHIISDGWSMDILIKELLTTYDAHVKGNALVLAPLRIQYKDYATWQQAQSETPALQEHRQYWLRQFEDTPPVLELPADRSRPVLKTYRGAEITQKLNTQLNRALKVFCRQEEATLFMGLLAGVNALLYRYTGQQDIVIGSMIAGREHADLEDQIGVYINTLALRTRFSGEAGYRNLLSDTRRTTLEAYRHQAYPYDELIEALQLRRETDRNALFDVMIVLQNAEGTAAGGHLAPAGLKISAFGEAGIPTSKFDLTFTFMESGDDLLIRVEYNTDIYREPTVERLLNHWQQLLAAMLEDPERPIAATEYLTANERNLLLTVFNETAAGYPRNKTLVALLEEQAAKTPAGTAVVSGETALSYQELNERSNQLADYLRKSYRLRPDDRVGVKLERNEWMIMAILAVLKSGGAYVPIDPLYPQERIDYMISDSECRLVIDAEELIRFGNAADKYEKNNPDPVNRPADLAYVIYTSGTTGQPKGALITHENVVRLFLTDKMQFDFTEKDVWTLFHSICFDFSVWEMYGALLFGGRLVIVPAPAAKDPDEMLALLEREGVTVLNQTPSSFYSLVQKELERKGTSLALRYIIFGGEALSPGKLAGWRARYPGIQLVNMYGITETTVHVTYKEITDAEIVANVSNIGRPIPTLRCYVMDKAQRLLPVGVPGELYVGGDGVCRGYLNRDELTRQKFIQSPFGQHERLYRSGDKVKMLENGEMEYLGRMDDQVKIRGYRIELGEIENALLGLEDIEDATVLVRADGQGDKQLVAYLISRKELMAPSLRNALAARLPAYMIPSFFVRLEKFPMTKNGKLDKKAFPAPAEADIARGPEYLAPRDEMETRMAGIWEAVLGRRNIGIRDGFFESGGDSIKVLRMISEVKAELGLRLSMASVYKNSTIEAILLYTAQYKMELEADRQILEREESLIRQEFDELQERILASGTLTGAENIETMYPMSAIERGMAFSSMLNPGSGVYHDQFVYQRVFRDFSVDRFQLALQRLADRHPILRTSFNTDDYETDLQLVSKRIPVSVGCRDISGLDGGQQEITLQEYLKAELANPFRMGTAPLWRMTAFDMGADTWAFVWQFHHAIIDGWSNASFITELNNLYWQLGENPSFVPEKLRSDYRDFVVREEMDRRNEAIKDFWKKELADFTRMDLFGGEDDFRGGMYDFGRDFPEKIQATATLLNTTVKVISLSAWLYLLRILGSTREVVSGLVTNTRPDCPDGDRILGCFLNSIPLKMTLNGDEKSEELVRRVHEKLIGLKDKERLPLAGIALLNNEQQEEGNPFFDVLFNYVDFHVYNSMRSGSAGTEAGKEESIGSLWFGWERTNTSLDFSISVTGGNFLAQLNASRKLKSGIPADKMLQMYAGILNYIVEHPGGRLKDLDLLKPEEKDQLLSAFNGHSAVDAEAISVIALFEAQAHRSPDQLAVIFEKDRLTYRELNERANRFAAYLHSAFDVRDEDLVGILLDRSDGMIVAILGVLKCGCAYLPIDTGYPQGRINYILEDSRCTRVVDEKTLEQFRENENSYSGDNPPLQDTAAPAYVIYTSGSTGLPKGTVITHHNLSNYVRWANSFYFKEIGEVNFGLFTSLSFDLTVTSLFCPLTRGGRLTVFPAHAELTDILEQTFSPESGINCIKLTPSHVYLLKHLDIEPSQMKVAIVGGEAVTTEHVTILKGIHPAIKIYNEYGPTEATVGCIVKELMEDEPVLIGRPIAGVKAYMLDDGQGLCPVGIPGEIYIGGEGLATGYLNRPELTAERFVPNPFCIGERMYRTGDGGRWLPDGNIEFLGRLDDQVKIRGYRVEVKEIEQALLDYPGIDAAVVLTRGRKSSELELVAYMTGSPALDTTDIRAFLGMSLPAFMLPARFVRLDSFPLTTNGKIDRKALPEPQGLEIESSVMYVAPGNATEWKLVSIWKDILGKEKIGIKDNFFALGGHSLNVTRLASRIHKNFQLKPDLKQLFQHPVLEDQAKLIARAERTSFAPILPAPIKPCYPLSSSQRRIWVVSQFEQGNIAYNMPGVYVMEGDVKVSGLGLAFEALLRRHEILRTVFREDDQGEIRQYILEPEQAEFSIVYKDMRQEADPEAQVRQWIEEIFNKPFHLTTGPLLRTALLRLEDRKWICVYVMHHIISDGWSVGILLNELLLLYHAYSRDNEPSLAPLRIQYKDFAHWQREQLSEERLAFHRKYWLQQFEGELPVLEWPEDKTRPTIKTYNGGIVNQRLGSAVSAGIKALSQEAGCTLFMGLLAAVNTFLYQYTGQEDIIIGSPAAGREHADLEDQIGCYVNTLALRTRFSGHDSFLTVLEKVRKITLEAYEHQVYPFDELVDELNLRRDMSRNPLFDVMLMLQNAASGDRIREQGPEGLKVTSYQNGEQFLSKFDLTFGFVETDDELHASIVYNSDIYRKETIERSMEHMLLILKAAVEDPRAPVNRLDYLTREEKTKMLVEFNDTAADYPRQMTIVDLFEAQVEKTPGRVAVVFEGKGMTYKELNDKSNQLSGYLRLRYHLGEGDLAAIRLERSEWMIIAILGILKAKGAYVPVDPGHPREWIAYVAADSKYKIAVDKEEIGKFEKEASRYATTNRTDRPAPEELAYVIYTSGSTGKPKGVMTEHRAAVNLITAQKATFSISNEDNILQYSTISFDASVEQIFIALTGGATLTLIDKDTARDSVKLENFIDSQHITHVHMVPDMLRLLPVRKYGSLRRVISGGDSCPKELAQSWSIHHPFYNEYGPTETTITSIELSFNEWTQERDMVPIGRPIANTRVFILRDDQLVPIGAAGEICIAGDGLARGYLHQPALTGEKFVPHPFETGQRLYRTGDMGRWLPDGNIAFLGRKDQQVKIRGHRIELEEIERVLQDHPDIDSAVVAARLDREGGKELIAYFLSAKKMNSKDLRADLAMRLPGYMLPAYFVQLDAIPHSSNGKVDKRRLPEPEDRDRGAKDGYIPPRTTTEEVLAAIWKNVLGVEKVGPLDDFFEFGGHSLKAAKLVNLIYRQFGIKMTLKDIFVHPLLEKQARLITRSRKETFADLPRASAQMHYPLSSSQRLFWVSCQFEEANIAYNIPGAYLLEGSLDLTTLEQSFFSLIQRHESLRTVFRQDEQGEIRQFILSAEGIGFSMVTGDYRHASEDQLATGVRSVSIKPFDLAAGPLLRVHLFQVADDKWLLSYAIHHIISDGRSMAILIRELLLLYYAFVRGMPDPLSPLPIQYKDYAVWQQEQLANGAFKKQQAWWAQQFDGTLPALLLPAAKRRPAMKTYNGGMVDKTFSGAATADFKALVHEQGCTLFMGLLAAVDTLLYRYTGQTDIIIGTSVAGRDYPGLEDQIGYYLNTLALRTQFSAEDSYSDLLAKVRQLMLDAYEHQDYPFEELVETLHLKRDLSRNNLFDVLVVLRNTDYQADNAVFPEYGDVQISPYKTVEQSVSKFDMTFSFVEMNDGLHVGIEYNSDLFNEASVIKIAEDLELLLCEITRQPLIPVCLLTVAGYGRDKVDLTTLSDRRTEFGSSLSTEF